MAHAARSAGEEARPAAFAVRARNLSAVAAGRMLVRAVSLEAAPGDSICLIGPNGAGKTTVLRLLGMLTPPAAGRLEWFDGLAPGPEVRRRIGYLGHETYLYGHLTARENLVYYATLGRVPDRRRAVDAILARVGLHRVADTPVRTFSRGMGQRLALARCLIGRPRLLLLDEPDSGLDLHGRRLLTDLMAQARADGAAVVWSGHDLDYAVGQSDRAMLLARGRVVHAGPAGPAAVATFAAAFPAAELAAPPSLRA